MAEEPMSAAAALLAVTEDERLIHPRDTKVDQFAQNIEAVSYTHLRAHET